LTQLVLNDFWLFPKIKSALKGRTFQGTEGIQRKSDNGIETGVPKMLPTLAASLG
jgi:hypothetical protein